VHVGDHVEVVLRRGLGTDEFGIGREDGVLGVDGGVGDGDRGDAVGVDQGEDADASGEYDERDEPGDQEVAADSSEANSGWEKVSSRHGRQA
jgi:hypothetical protein